MKKTVIALLLLAGTITGLWAVEPELRLTLDDVRAYVSVDGNYASLIRRIEAGDPGLTLEDYAMLYYGFTFTDKYAYDLSPAVEMDTYALAQQERYREAWDQCTEFLAIHPFSLFALNLGVYLAEERKDFETAYKYQLRSAWLLRLIETGGDGSVTYPFQVIYAGDMFYWLKYQIDVDNIVEALEVRPGCIRFLMEVDGTTQVVYFAQDLCNQPTSGNAAR